MTGRALCTCDYEDKSFRKSTLKTQSTGGNLLIPLKSGLKRGMVSHQGGISLECLHRCHHRQAQLGYRCHHCLSYLRCRCHHRLSHLGYRCHHQRLHASSCIVALLLGKARVNDIDDPINCQRGFCNVGC